MARAHFKSMILLMFQCICGCAVGDQSWWCALMSLFSYLLSVRTHMRVWDTHMRRLYAFVLAGSRVLLMSCLYKDTSKPRVHRSRLVMKPVADGSAAEATREEVPCSRSDLNVISQTLRGEPWEPSAWWGEVRGKGGMYAELVPLVSCLRDFRLLV